MFSFKRSKEFTVFADTNEVGIGNEKSKLTPKEMGVLQMLLDHSETTVSRTELLQKVWGDQFANDQGLTQAISRLRRILSQIKSVTITTIPKKGYHLRRREFEVKNSLLKWMKSRSNNLILILLVIVICILIFVKDIEIAIQ